MLKEAVILCRQERVNETLGNLLEAQGLSFLLAELPDERTVSTQYPQRGLQRDISEGTFLWQSGAQVEIKPRQPPQPGARNQYGISCQSVVHRKSSSPDGRAYVGPAAGLKEVPWWQHVLNRNISGLLRRFHTIPDIK